MRISRSTGYGLLAVGYIAKRPEQKIVLSQSISKEYDIPLEYLLKILQQMVRANILRSKRGPRGGFSLSKPINKITMLEIIEAIEGPLLSSLNLIEQAGKEKFCVKCEKVYEKALNQAKNVFDKTKVSELIS